MGWGWGLGGRSDWGQNVPEHFGSCVTTYRERHRTLSCSYPESTLTGVSGPRLRPGTSPKERDEGPLPTPFATHSEGVRVNRDYYLRNHVGLFPISPPSPALGTLPVSGHGHPYSLDVTSVTHETPRVPVSTVTGCGPFHSPFTCLHRGPPSVPWYGTGNRDEEPFSVDQETKVSRLPWIPSLTRCPPVQSDWLPSAVRVVALSKSYFDLRPHGTRPSTLLPRVDRTR